MAKEITETFVVRNIDSGHTEELTKAEWDAIQPRLKEKYEVKDHKKVAKPAELN